MLVQVTRSLLVFLILILAGCSSSAAQDTPGAAETPEVVNTLQVEAAATISGSTPSLEAGTADPVEGQGAEPVEDETPEAGEVGQPSARLTEHTPALLPAYQSELESLSGLPHYFLELNLDYADLTFTGQAQVDFTNMESEPLESLFFRLFPNGGKSYGNGALTVSQARINGSPAATETSLDDTVLEIILPDPLAAGESVQVVMDFAGVVPKNFGTGEDQTGYGIYNFYQGVIALSGWYPILAVYDAEGWNLDPVSAIGDSVYSDMAYYTVDVTVPGDLVLVATGVAVDSQPEGSTARYHYVSGPVRDFFLVASPDFEVLSRTVDGVQINSYYLPDHDEGGRIALSVASDSLAAFNELFGPYPYPELDVVDAPMNNAGGVEYPGIVLVAAHYYDEPDRVSLQVATSHEVAHQWWYNLVGNDVIDQPWLDEALATYSSGLYFEENLGQAGYRNYVDYLERSYSGLVDRGGDSPVTESLAYFEDLDQPGVYGGVVYTKGALFYAVLRDTIGDEAFFEGLQQYYEDYRYGIAETEDLLSAFEASSDRELDALYQEWLYEP